MKKLFFMSLVFVLAIPAFTDTIDFGITGHAPTVTGGPLEDSYNSHIQSAFNNVLDEIRSQFNDIEFASPKKFLRAMGNSSVYASHGATTRAYTGYKIFTATIGPMFGFQLPSSLGSIVKDLSHISETLERDGDINLGISPNILNINVGLNMGIFKINKLYLGLRVGYFKLPSIIENFKYSNFSFGITANYHIIPTYNLTGLVTWRGLSIGGGFIYNNSKISLAVPLGDPIYENIGGGLSGSIYMEPKAALNLNVNTFTIPLEAMTAIKVLIFNIPLGVGADLAFGKTSLKFGLNSDIKLIGLSSGYTKTTNGDVSVNAGASNTPTVFNFKIMTGLGFSMGPVVIDIPFTYYPASRGYNLGFTMGAVY